MKMTDTAVAAVITTLLVLDLNITTLTVSHRVSFESSFSLYLCVFSLVSFLYLSVSVFPICFSEVSIVDRIPKEVLKVKKNVFLRT